MSYVPNANDPTEPTEARKVESAALEFRTLKGAQVRDLRFPAADAPANRGELPVAASRAGRFLAFDSVTGVPITGPLISAWTITQAQIAAIDTVATNIVAVDNVSDNMAAILAAVAELPDLATKVSKTSDTGSAVMPAGTTLERDGSPLPGYTRFNEDTGSLEVWNGTGWAPAGAGASGPPNNPSFYEVDEVLTADYTIPAGKLAFRPGPLIINSGVTLTIESGASLVIVD